MKNRQYQGVQLSKKESELITWLQKGSNDYTQAFYEYKSRRKKEGIKSDQKKERSWFNRALKTLKSKGLCEHIPFAFYGLPWFNPGVTHDKAQLITEQKQDDMIENRHQKII